MWAILFITVFLLPCQAFASESHVTVNQTINSNSSSTVIINGSKPTIIKNQQSRVENNVNVEVNASGSTGAKVVNKINIENEGGKTEVKTNSQELKNNGVEVDEDIRVNGREIIPDQVKTNKFINLRINIMDKFKSLKETISNWIKQLF